MTEIAGWVSPKYAREMPKDSYTIKVGEMSDAARFYLKNQHEVLPLLNLFLSD